MNRWIGVIFLGFAMGTFCVGCRTVAFQCDPCPPVRDAWVVSLENHLDHGAEAEAWWKGYGDPSLEALICGTKQGNPLFDGAAQRILQLRAERSATKATLYPSMSGFGSAARTRASDNLIFRFDPNPSNLFVLGASTSWELDFFGRVAHRLEAADASIEASKESYRDLVVLLFSETAVTYLKYRTTQARLAVAAGNVRLQEKSEQLAQDKLNAGLVSEIDVSQAQTNLETTRSQIPQLQNELARLKNRLVTLVGGNRKSVSDALAKNHGIPVPPGNYATGVPCDLIRSRPDIREAERNLAAAAAAVGVAEAELYPRLSLGGDFSFQSLQLKNLMSASSGALAFGPSFSWNLFKAGQIRKLIVAEEAKTGQALAAYESTVLTAVEEVETAMASIVYEKRRYESLNRAATAATKTVNLVLDNYEEGLIDFQRVVDAQRAQFQSQDQLAVSRGQIAVNYTLLYKALGGGSRVHLVPLEEPLDRQRGPFPFKKKAVILEPATPSM